MTPPAWTPPIVVLRCTGCRRELDRVEWRMGDQPTLCGPDYWPAVVTPAVKYGAVVWAEGNGVTYQCKCGRRWPVSLNKALAAAERARTLGRRDIFAGRTDYGVPSPP